MLVKPFASLALALALCGGCALLPNATDAEVAKLNEDVAELQADLAALNENSPQIREFVAQIAAGNYVGAAITLSTILPSLANPSNEILKDIKQIAKDLVALVTDDEVKASLRKTAVHAEGILAERRARTAAMRIAQPAK